MLNCVPLPTGSHKTCVQIAIYNLKTKGILSLFRSSSSSFICFLGLTGSGGGGLCCGLGATSKAKG